MNQPESPRRFSLAIVVTGIICLLVVLFGFLLVSPDLPIHTLLGWCFYLNSISTKIRLDLPAILQFVLATAVFVGLTHSLARYFFTQTKIGTNWRLRNSVLITLALFVSFAAGLSFVGAVHQIGWLAREPRIMTNSFSTRAQIRNQLSQIGKGAYEYQDKWASFPAGGTLLDHAVPGHSWQTHLLPYLDQQNLFCQINLKQSWRAISNRTSLSTTLSVFNNPRIDGSRKQEHTRYALSHFAINSHLAPLGGSVTLKDMPDGNTHTLFAGEVISNFKPWGDPSNRRDPLLGLNTSPQGFGGTMNLTTHFIMADGSVRGIYNKIDPKILKAIATPDGGEEVGQF